MGLKEEIGRLKEQLEGRQPWRVPIETLVLCKEHARCQAIREGKVPPPYTPEERDEVHRHDLELLDGGADRQRMLPGWQTQRRS
jgi:hypothetical protein